MDDLDVIRFVAMDIITISDYHGPRPKKSRISTKARKLLPKAPLKPETDANI
jgi:hypothetical protein